MADYAGLPIQVPLLASGEAASDGPFALCGDCGSVVLDREQHDYWHVRQMQVGLPTPVAAAVVAPRGLDEGARAEVFDMIEDAFDARLR